MIKLWMQQGVAKCFLCDIFSIIAVVKEAQGQTIHLIAM